MGRGARQAQAQGHAQAGGDAVPGVLRHRAAQAFADFARGLQCGVRQHEQEFVAAHAADEVRPACGIAQQLAQAFEHLVAHAVAEVVVDGFEAVHVHHHQRQRQLAGRRVAQQIGQALLDLAPVAHAGERVAAHVGFELGRAQALALRLQPHLLGFQARDEQFRLRMQLRHRAPAFEPQIGLQVLQGVVEAAQRRGRARQGVVQPQPRDGLLRRLHTLQGALQAVPGGRRLALGQFELAQRAMDAPLLRLVAVMLRRGQRGLQIRTGLQQASQVKQDLAQVALHQHLREGLAGFARQGQCLLRRIQRMYQGLARLVQAAGIAQQMESADAQGRQVAQRQQQFVPLPMFAGHRQRFGHQPLALPRVAHALQRAGQRIQAQRLQPLVTAAERQLLALLRERQGPLGLPGFVGGQADLPQHPHQRRGRAAGAQDRQQGVGFADHRLQRAGLEQAGQPQPGRAHAQRRIGVGGQHRLQRPDGERTGLFEPRRAAGRFGLVEPAAHLRGVAGRCRSDRRGRWRGVDRACVHASQTAVGIANSAPLPMLSGQRCITLFWRV